MGIYTEMIFPQKNVCFISINDIAQGDNDFAPLRNISNEMFLLSSEILSRTYLKTIISYKLYMRNIQKTIKK